MSSPAEVIAAWLDPELPAAGIWGANKILAALVDAGWVLVKGAQNWPFCPFCGRRNRHAGAADTDASFCSPTNCKAWVTTATFDHETREWVPVEEGEQ